jgi:hypothetical protein
VTCEEYLRELARRCFALSANCFDLGVAGKLREMSHEMMSKATEMDRSPERGRPPLETKNGTSEGR